MITPSMMTSSGRCLEPSRILRPSWSGTHRFDCPKLVLGATPSGHLFYLLMAWNCWSLVVTYSHIHLHLFWFHSRHQLLLPSRLEKLVLERSSIPPRKKEAWSLLRRSLHHGEVCRWTFIRWLSIEMPNGSDISSDLMIRSISRSHVPVPQE